MSYIARSYVVLSSGALKQIGVQTLQKVLDGREPCKLAVDGELRIIEMTCSKENGRVSAIQRIWFPKHKLLPTGYIDQADYRRSLRVSLDQLDILRRGPVTDDQAQAELDALEVAAQEWTWTPTADQLKECRIKLGLPA